MKHRRSAPLSSKICVRPGCGRRITRLAERHGDPYCSRDCLRLDLGLPDVNVLARDFGAERARALLAVGRRQE